MSGFLEHSGQVQVSQTDKAEGPLGTELVAGAGIILTVLNPSGNERLMITSLGGVPAPHKASHENGGIDEINVAGLNGVLANAQNADQIQGRNVAATAPTVGSGLVWNPATVRWEPMAVIQDGSRLANGQLFEIMSIPELTTVLAAAFTDTTIQIPAFAVVFSVSVRVVTAIPTAATFDVGVAGATTRYGAGLSVAAGTTHPGTNDATRFYSNAISIRLTPNLVPAAATGQVRVTICYYVVTPPTS